MMIFPIIILSIYGLLFIGGLILLVWTIRSRIKEKKKEDIEFKNYKNY